MLKLQQFAVYVTLLSIVVCREPCLHNGCELSAGLKIQQVDETVSRLLKPGEFKDNVMTAVSWNIRQTDIGSPDQWVTSKKDVCRYLQRLNPTVCCFFIVLNNSFYF